MVNLTRIYTRTGDDGTTSLGDMSRTGKNDPRLKAYADVDEANCTIGVILASCEVREDIAALLLSIQNDLFDVGADLCTPIKDDETGALRVTDSYIERLEAACDHYNEGLDPLRSFVLPGGTAAAAHMHVARTVSRRAERSTWAALDAYHGGMNPLTATYLNRLSDLLFI
ncbi:MAG: cob(I)yrinic acid a,c-diamide adenosyltransferase, partial [Candidatus Nanopelagicales bacterium]